jgi:thymidine kinase
MGKLEIFLGPMFAGKSTEIIRRIRKMKFIGKKILVVKPQIDNRYNEDKITSHDYETADCIIVTNLSELQNIKDYNTIIIDEGQFFNDLKENVILWVDTFDINVVIAGLDGDFQRQPIGQILELIPYADSCVKLNALCSKCKDGTNASFSHRIINSNEQILIGGSDTYIPLCRKCYLNMNKK